MFCKIFKSNTQADTYVYIPAESDFEQLPNGMKAHFGEPEFVMDLELSLDKKLARNNVEQIMRDIREQGYHLQMPLGDYFLT